MRSLVFVFVLAGCVGGAAAAEAGYTSELLRCVDKAATLAESKACRREVDAKWGIADAGSEQ